MCKWFRTPANVPIPRNNTHGLPHARAAQCRWVGRAAGPPNRARSRTASPAIALQATGSLPARHGRPCRQSYAPAAVAHCCRPGCHPADQHAAESAWEGRCAHQQRRTPAPARVLAAVRSCRQVCLAIWLVRPATSAQGQAGAALLKDALLSSCPAGLPLLPPRHQLATCRGMPAAARTAPPLRQMCWSWTAPTARRRPSRTTRGSGTRRRIACWPATALPGWCWMR